MSSPSSATVPPRPKMPTRQDEARSVYQSARNSILEDDYDKLADEWLREHVDEENLEAWGIVDTSANPLASMARQLTVPGLYGARPTWRHPAGNEGLIGHGGELDRAGYHTLMQWVQYMTVGMGDFLVRMGARADGQLTVRPVNPRDVWVRTHPDEPTRALELWELRLFWQAEAGCWVWAWEQFILDGPEPVYRVAEARRDGGAGEDLSGVFLRQPDAPGVDGPRFGAMTGDAYPWRRADGTARLPYVRYTAIDAGRFWNHNDKRGAHRGTLNTALYSTYAGRCALHATGSMVLVAGLRPVNVDVQAAQGGIGVSKGRQLRTIKTTPGALVYHETIDDAQPMVREIGPGVNLPVVDEFARNTELRVGMREGLNSPDTQRTAANPSSGISLYISRQDRREFSERVEPLFRAADLDAVELAAIILRRATGVVYDERGYSITYREIPRSPQEEKDRRESLEWRVAQGLMSRVEMFQALNPGTTEQDAHTAIVAAAVSNARVEADVAAIVGVADAEPKEPDADVMTINERRALDGLDPLPDGGAVYMPSNLIPAIEAG